MAARRPLVLVTSGLLGTLRRLINGDSLIVEEFADRNGVKWLKTTAVGGAVNYARIDANATGGGPLIYAEGSDADINLHLVPKNNGQLMYGFDAVLSEQRSAVVTNKDLRDPSNILPFNAGRGSVRQVVKDPLAATVTLVGFPTAMTTDGAVSSADHTVRPLMAYTTGATAGNKSGFVTPAAVATRNWRGEVVIPIRLGPSVADVRIWVGFMTADLATVTHPTTQHVAAFRFDSASDSEFIAVTCDGASGTAENGTGISPNADEYHELRVRMSDTQVDFYIDDVQVSSETGVLPGLTTPTFVRARVETLTNAAKVLRVGSWALAMK